MMDGGYILLFCVNIKYKAFGFGDCGVEMKVVGLLSLYIRRTD